jgi:protein-disulfide isomerase
MHSKMKFASLAGTLLIVSLAAACSKAAPDKVQAATVGAADIPEVLATIGNEKVTLADIRTRAGDQLDQIEAQYQRNRSNVVESALNDIIREKVIDAEAQKQGKTVDQLVQAEAGGTFEPTDVEIQEWYTQNQARLGGRTMESLKLQIADVLRKKKKEQAEQALQARLDKERGVVVKFEPFRLKFNNENAPRTGNASSPVTLVEFSDFQCPFCRQFAPNMGELAKNYGSKINIVYRQYPIPSLHPFAFKAAEASLCANEQGKFWELHDLMFSDQQHITIRDLKEKARRLGMDGNKFDSCLDTGKYTEQVQNDMAEGNKAGVTGTPALFVNGVEVPGGAVPYATVAGAIERELARSGSPKTN